MVGTFKASLGGSFLLVALTMAVPSTAADLRQGFTGAIELNAEIRALTAQRDVLAARRRGSETLLPGAPSINPSWSTQVNPRRTGYQEFEISVEAPLWLPGESRALRGSVSSQDMQLVARLRQARVLVAGELRDSYWNWSVALAEREAARARLAAARNLSRDVARQAASGQVPRTDLLLAQADLREAEAALRSTEGGVRDAALAFRALTGQNPTVGPPERPASAPPAGIGFRDLPQAALTHANLDLARAEERLAGVRDRASPTLFAGWRREREAFGEQWSDRTTIGIRIPFSYGPQTEERVATARAEAIAAEASLATLARGFEAAVRRSRAHREDAEALASLAEQRHRALAEQAGLIETAYRAGNVPFIELVRTRAQLAQADAARRRTRVERDRAASTINQILGIEP
jgi:cobalt-zinc-cadmium efflux system outer membrane protein